MADISQGKYPASSEFNAALGMLHTRCASNNGIENDQGINLIDLGNLYGLDSEYKYRASPDAEIRPLVVSFSIGSHRE